MAPDLPRSHATSLKLTLILPYVVLIALLTGTIGVLSYWAGSRTVSTLSDRLLIEMAERISQAIDRHVHGSSAVLEAAFPDGMPAAPDIRDGWDGLRTRFWTATSLHTQPNDYVYYGNIAGQGIGLKRLGPNEAELRAKTRPEEHRRYSHFTGINGPLHYQSTEANLFDPRERPWFKLAQNAPSHTWTSVYIDFGIKDLVVTRARKVLSASGAFEGVVATDVSLLALNQFVDKLGMSVNGRAFIIQPGGELIAASGMHNVRQRGDGTMERVTSESSGDPVIQAVYAEIQPLFSALTPVSAARSLVLQDVEGQTIHVAFRHVIDSAGLDWIAVVAVPRSDILAGVTRHVLLVVGAGLLALALAVVIGLRVFGRVANDVSALSQAVRLVGGGEIDAPIDVQRTDEVGELARNFQRMRHELFTDPLTGIANRSALQHFLAALMRAPAQGAATEPFALLFIDLNRFKPLNDRHGHDNGDRALAEVAQRLRQTLRTEDHVARLGGDEFVAVLRGIPDHHAAQSVRAKVEAALLPPLTTLEGIPEGEEVTLGASVGVACYPEDGRDAQTLLKHADQDMYRDKKARSPGPESRI